MKKTAQLFLVLTTIVVLPTAAMAVTIGPDNPLTRAYAITLGTNQATGEPIGIIKDLTDSSCDTYDMGTTSGLSANYNVVAGTKVDTLTVVSAGTPSVTCSSISGPGSSPFSLSALVYNGYYADLYGGVEADTISGSTEDTGSAGSNTHGQQGDDHIDNNADRTTTGSSGQDALHTTGTDAETIDAGDDNDTVCDYSGTAASLTCGPSGDTDYANISGTNCTFQACM